MLKTIYHKLYKSRDSDNKELIKGGASAFIVRIIGIGINYIFTILVSRLYGAGGMGIFSIYQSVLQFFSNISKLGYNTLLLRYVAFYEAKDKWDLIKDLYYKSLRLTVFTGIIFSAILYFGAGFIAEKILLKPELTIYFQLAAFVLLPWILMEVHSDSIRGMKLIFASSFIRQVVLFVVACIAVVVLAPLTHNKLIPEAAYGIGMLCTSAVSIYWWLKKAKFPKQITEHVNFSSMSIVALTLFATTLLYMLRSWAETLIIGRYGTISDVGIYKIGIKISTATSLTLGAMIFSLQPKIAELHGKNDIKKLADVVQNTTAIIFWTSAPILLCFLLFPSFFMGIYGAEFKQSIGVKILMILTVGQFINAATGPVSNVLMLAGKQTINTGIVFFSTITCVALDFIIIPRYGIVGAAWVNVIGFILFNVIPLFFVKLYFGFYTLSFRKLFSFRKLLSQ